MEQTFKEKQPDYLDDNFYTEEEIEVLLEDDEITASEEAFMRGYIDA